MISAERLRELLTYDEATGIFKRRVDKGRAHKGAVAGSPNGNGYIKIPIDGERHYAHRLAWLYIYGEWPEQIDHKDHVRDHNWIANLRNATQSQNLGNTAKKRFNTSGIKGVSWCKQTGKWRAVISINGTPKCLGRYETKDQASAAYRAAAVERFGNFAHFDEAKEAAE